MQIPPLSSTGREGRGLAALFLLSLSWGCVGLSIRALQGALTPFQQIAATNLLGCLLITGMRLVRGEALVPRISVRLFAALQLRVVLIALIAVPLFFHAVRAVSVAEAAWVSGLPFSAFWGWVLFRERFDPRLWAALVLSCAGSAVLFAEKGAGMQLSTGLLAAGGSGALFALAAVATRHIGNESRSGAVEWYILILSGLYTGAAALLYDGVPEIPSVAGCGWLLAGGMQLTLNTTLLLYGFARVPSTVASVVLTLESLWATGVSVLILGESLSLQACVGGALLTVAALIPCILRAPATTLMERCGELEGAENAPVVRAEWRTSERGKHIGAEGSGRRVRTT